MAAPPPTYTREEMDAILKRALERQQERETTDGGDGIGHEDLVEAAGEVGIPREEVEAAARELAEQNQRAKEKEKAASEKTVRDRVREMPRREDALAGASDGRKRELRLFFARAVYFGLITAVAFVISGMHWNGWWIWAALGFGLSLARSAIRIVSGAGDDFESMTAARPSRGARRAERRARRDEARIAFEQKVTFGAEAILRVIDEARRVKVQGVDRAPPPPEPAGPRIIVTPAPAARAVRVDPVESRETEPLSPEDEPSAAGSRQKRVP